jgi:hypothetical protein
MSSPLRTLAFDFPCLESYIDDIEQWIQDEVEERTKRTKEVLREKTRLCVTLQVALDETREKLGVNEKKLVESERVCKARELEVKQLIVAVAELTKFQQHGRKEIFDAIDNYEKCNKIKRGQ